MSSEKKGNDSLQKCLSFIKKNENIKERVSTYFGDCNDYSKIITLFKKEETFDTNANEVPNADGKGWHYNGTYFVRLCYALLDNNRLLSVLMMEDFVFDEQFSLKLELYPNADKMIARIKPGHDKQPYLNITYEDGSLVSEYPYERIDLSYDCEKINNEKIVNLLSQVSTDTLEERIEERKQKSKIKSLARTSALK